MSLSKEIGGDIPSDIRDIDDNKISEETLMYQQMFGIDPDDINTFESKQDIEKPKNASKYCFKSMDQFDERFDYIFKEYPKSKRGIANGVFCLITAEEFLSNGIVTDTKHHENLERAINTAAILEITEYVSLQELFKGTSINDPKVCRVNAHNLRKDMDDKNINTMISKRDNNYVIIVRKNERFITILYDSRIDAYHLRDADSLFQYSFLDEKKFFDFMCEVYALTNTFTFGGIPMYEYDNYSYIVLTESFSHNLDIMITEKILTASQPDNDDTDIMELQRRFGGINSYDTIGVREGG